VMASNYNRRPAAGRGAGRRRHLARPSAAGKRWTTAGFLRRVDRDFSSCHTVLSNTALKPSDRQRATTNARTTSSPSKASIRAASRRRRSAARTASRRMPQGALVSFPDYGTSIGEKSRAPARRRAGIRPRRDAAAVCGEPLRAKTGPRTMARRRARPRLRPLYGVERRVWRGDGPRPGVAGRHAEAAASSRADHRAGHRPRDSREAQGRGPRPLRARSRACRPGSAKAITARPRSPAGSCSTASDRKTSSPPRCTTRRCHDSRSASLSCQRRVARLTPSRYRGVDTTPARRQRPHL
jgi:hypothetical protein